MRHPISRRALALCFAISLLVPARPAHANELVDRLKDVTMEFAKGCDYSKYFETVNLVVKNWDWEKIKGWSKWNPFAKGGIPATDYISSFFKLGARKAAEESAKLEQKSLVYQLEQVCQTAVQMYETNRVHQIVQAGHLNIGNALDYLAELVDTKLLVTPGAGGEHISLDHVDAYKNTIPESQFPEDKIYVEMHEILMSNIKETQESLKALERYEKRIQELEQDMILYAERVDEGGKLVWKCPDGYPDGETLTPNPITGKRVCGPQPPERMVQIGTALEAVIAHIKAIDNATLARHGYLKGIDLMTENQQRRMDRYVATRPVNH